MLYRELKKPELGTGGTNEPITGKLMTIPRLAGARCKWVENQQLLQSGEPLIYLEVKQKSQLETFLDRPQVKGDLLPGKAWDLGCLSLKTFLLNDRI